mmetsp:Transcript_14484/g.37560  ORF Transcript_14484/g.37560 Transcript_14484/m.37560 type:complete len:328 (+) Transcript_14484:291-1274(+)
MLLPPPLASCAKRRVSCLGTPMISHAAYALRLRCASSTARADMWCTSSRSTTSRLRGHLRWIAQQHSRRRATCAGGEQMSSLGPSQRINSLSACTPTRASEAFPRGQRRPNRHSRPSTGQCAGLSRSRRCRRRSLWSRRPLRSWRLPTAPIVASSERDTAIPTTSQQPRSSRASAALAEARRHSRRPTFLGQAPSQSGEPSVSKRSEGDRTSSRCLCPRLRILRPALGAVSARKNLRRLFDSAVRALTLTHCTSLNFLTPLYHQSCFCDLSCGPSVLTVVVSCMSDRCRCAPGCAVVLVAVAAVRWRGERAAVTFADAVSTVARSVS